MYTQEDIDQVWSWFKEFGLRLLDLHGTSTSTYDGTPAPLKENCREDCYRQRFHKNDRKDKPWPVRLPGSALASTS